MISIAARTARIAPFYVMEIAKEAARLQAAGQPVIYLNIGEPDFTAPPAVVEAAQRAIAAGATGYTPALGLPSLRRAIAADYQRVFGLKVDAERIVVTAGASAALLLAVAACVDPGAGVLLPDPTYPCNRNFVEAFDGEPQLVPCPAATRFQLTPQLADPAWRANTRGMIVATPSNPTGTSIPPATLGALLALAQERGGFAIVDEIYQRLTYDAPPSTALSMSDEAIVINSFSKYFNMTGWRLGWLVVPHPLVPVVERLAQNLYICPPAVAQRAALACFLPDSIAIYEERRLEFRRRRDFVVAELTRIGFEVPAVPDGAFYAYVDVGSFSTDSWQFAFDLLHETGVCVAPGRDFGTNETHRYVRVSYATDMALIAEAMERIARYLAGSKRRSAAGERTS